MDDTAKSPEQLTRLLRDWNSGDANALELLTEYVYNELHRLARNSMSAERPGHVLQPSALVNEAFVRLMSGSQVEWKNRAHFFAIAARLMRQILVDVARTQSTAKRGNRAAHIDVFDSAANLAVEPNQHSLMDVDAALKELAQLHERQARVVELRYFGGLENGEIAEVLGISEDTITRDWKAARRWLQYRLRTSSSIP